MLFHVIYLQLTVVSCGNPGTPANGKIAFTAGNSYVYGNILKATCNHGYRLLGTSIRTCQANGQWTGTAPSCQCKIFMPFIAEFFTV